MRTFLMQLRPRERIFRFFMPERGIIRSMQFVDRDSCLGRQNMDATIPRAQVVRWREPASTSCVCHAAFKDQLHLRTPKFSCQPRAKKKGIV